MLRYDRTPLGDARFWCDAVKRTSDPTGTQDIRKKFGVLAEQRLRQVRNALQQSVVGVDILGLKPASLSPLALAGSTGNREIGFQTWFDNLLRTSVVEGGTWMRPLLALSYGRAVRRAQRLTNSIIVPHDMAETIDALAALALIELQGIVEAVSQRVMRSAISAWLHNMSPAQAFAEMAKAISEVGVARAKAMAALMTVKAFTTGTLDTFEGAGVKRVGLIAETLPARTRDHARVRDAVRSSGGPGSRSSRSEVPSVSTIGRIRGVASKLEEAFSAEGDEEQAPNVNVQTAGDELVCQVCEDIEGDNPYTLDEARSLIPAHPGCRCAFVPDEEEGFFGKVFGAIKGFFGGLFGDEWNEEDHPRGEGRSLW